MGIQSQNTSTESRVKAVKETRRQHLIAATLKAIGKVGYSGVALHHVAQEAGLSPSIVNFYFKSKEQLLLATLEQITLDYSSHWQVAIGKGRIAPESGLDAIIALDFQPSVCNPEKISIWLAFWSESGHNGRYRDMVSRLEAEYTGHTENLCARLAEEGGYGNIDPKAAAIGLNALIDGLWFDCLIDPDHFNREDAKQICRLYLNGLFPGHFSRPRGINETIIASAPSEIDTTANESREAHKRRLSAALRKRIEPVGPWTKAGLAARLGIGIRTLDGWLSGIGEPTSFQIERLIAVGDAQFWLELYGHLQPSLQQRYEEKLRQVKEDLAKEFSTLSSFRP